MYHDYNELKELYGEHAAKVLIAFRRSHISELQHVASVEDIQKESQCRETEHLDVFTCPTAFATAKSNLAKWRAEMPLEASSFVSYERDEAIQVGRMVMLYAALVLILHRNITWPTRWWDVYPTPEAPCTHTVSSHPYSRNSSLVIPPSES